MASIQWYSLGDTNEILSSKVPYFSSGISVENETPVIYVSNTDGENANSITRNGFVSYKGVNLKIVRNAVYVDRSESLGLRDKDGVLQLGVKHD